MALKFLPPHLRHDEELKRRLTEEARAASTLDHANIVVIHDIDETPDGDLFIAMAFHEGVTLRDRIGRDQPAGLPVAEALQIARQIASGLAKAHERGILHRDIKPGNIIVDKDGVARIIDFGLAKSTRSHRDPGWLHERDSALHVSRAGLRQAARLPHRPVEPGSGSLRDAGGPAAIFGRREPGDPARHRARRAAPVARDPARPAPGSRPHRFAGAGEGPGQAVSVGLGDGCATYPPS